MKVIKKSKNKYAISDENKVIDITDLKDKNIKSLSKAELDRLIIALAQLAGLADPQGKLL